MFHELRTYRVTSPNMMKHLHARMETRMDALFTENGMRAVGAWETVIGKQMPTYMYMLEWDNLTHREDGWNSFYGDPRVAEMNNATHQAAGGELFHDFDVALLKPASYLQFGSR